MSSVQCFTTSTELRTAIVEYIQPGIASNPNSDIALQYGWPINNWCVTKITNFSNLFTPPENDDSDTSTLFNETIADWDMSSAIDLSGMFEGAFGFNQDVSKWDISKVTSIDRMFYGAFSFDRDLCDWATKLPDDVSTEDVFFDTSCPISDDPDGTAGPFCYNCDDGDTSGGDTSTTTDDAEDTLTDNTTPKTGKCFETRLQLELALAEYLIDNSPDTDVAEEYGYPINSWCVTNITDFSYLFSPVNNLDKSGFNEDISGWDMSKASTLEGMFEENEFFNQDLSAWKLSKDLTNAYRMFFGAKAFNQNLCQWGQGVNAFTSDTTNVTQMFRDTSCPSILDPTYDDAMAQPGPFCYDCDGSTSTSTTGDEDDDDKDTPTAKAPTSPDATPTSPNASPSSPVGDEPKPSPTKPTDADKPSVPADQTPPEPGSTGSNKDPADVSDSPPEAPTTSDKDTEDPPPAPQTALQNTSDASIMKAFRNYGLLISSIVTTMLFVIAI